MCTILAEAMRRFLCTKTWLHQEMKMVALASRYNTREPYISEPNWSLTFFLSVIIVCGLSWHEMLKHVRVSEVETSIKELYQLWKTNSDNGIRPVLVGMQGLFGDLTLNISVRMVAGKRYFGASAEVDKSEARRLMKGIKELFRLLGLFLVSDALQFLWWLDVQGHEKAMKKTAKDLDIILESWLEEHKQNKSIGETVMDRDFMDVMLSTLEDKKALRSRSRHS